MGMPAADIPSSCCRSDTGRVQINQFFGKEQRHLRHNQQTQSQGHHTVARLEESNVERGSFQGTRNQTNIGTVSMATLWKILRVGWSPYGLFRARKYYLELNNSNKKNVNGNLYITAYF